MKDLWSALAAIALDVDLRQAVRRIAEGADFVTKAYCDERLHKQPNLGALRKIDDAFRTRQPPEKPLHLTAYSLAEINRWFKEDPAEFEDSLDKLKSALKEAGIPPSSEIPDDSADLLAAIGVLVSDPGLCGAFVSQTANLRDHGFQISKDDENKLRRAFENGSAAKESALQVHTVGWPGGSCLSVMRVYEDMFHPNR